MRRKLPTNMLNREKESECRVSRFRYHVMTFLKAIYTMLVADNYCIPNGLIDCLYTYGKRLGINIRYIYRFV
jgi:hypothetical protein